MDNFNAVFNIENIYEPVIDVNNIPVTQWGQEERKSQYLWFVTEAEEQKRMLDQKFNELNVNELNYNIMVKLKFPSSFNGRYNSYSCNYGLFVIKRWVIYEYYYDINGDLIDEMINKITIYIIIDRKKHTSELQSRI